MSRLNNAKKNKQSDNERGIKVNGHVDIRKLKIWATKLEEYSILRNVLLLELDTLPKEEYVAKIPTWLSIAEAEQRRERRCWLHG